MVIEYSLPCISVNNIKENVSELVIIIEVKFIKKFLAMERNG